MEPLHATLGPDAAIHRLFGRSPSRTGNRISITAPRNVYLAADGEWVAFRIHPGHGFPPVRHDATELAGSGINVNAIAPGPIATALSATVHAAGGTRDAYPFLTPQHRYGEVSEIAQAAPFLASADSDYVNGRTLNVDGGFGAAGLMYPRPARPSATAG